MNFSLGKPQAPPRTNNLLADNRSGPALRGPDSFGQSARLLKGHVEPSWFDLLHQWWLEHGYYPDQALSRGEDGNVSIVIVVDRSGHVDALDLAARSGSVWLDLGAQAVFRGAKLPPLPADTPDDQITVELNIRYILVRR
jgi:TonB family protein